MVSITLIAVTLRGEEVLREVQDMPLTHEGRAYGEARVSAEKPFTLIVDITDPRIKAQEHLIRSSRVFSRAVRFMVAKVMRETMIKCGAEREDYRLETEI